EEHHVADHVPDAIRLRSDAVERGAAHGIGLVAKQLLHAADDRRQRIIDLVPGPGGEFRQGGEMISIRRDMRHGNQYSVLSTGYSVLLTSYASTGSTSSRWHIRSTSVSTSNGFCRKSLAPASRSSWTLSSSTMPLMQMILVSSSDASDRTRLQTSLP